MVMGGAEFSAPVSAVPAGAGTNGATSEEDEEEDEYEIILEPGAAAGAEASTTEPINKYGWRGGRVLMARV